MSTTPLGTCTALYYFTNLVSQPQNVSRVTITPIMPGPAWNAAVVAPYIPPYTRANTPSLTNGFLGVTNIACGYAFQVVIADGAYTTTITNFFDPMFSNQVVNAAFNVAANFNNGAPFQPCYLNAIVSNIWQVNYASTNVLFISGTNTVYRQIGITNTFDVPNGLFDTNGAYLWAVNTASNQAAAATNQLATSITANLNSASNALMGTIYSASNAAVNSAQSGVSTSIQNATNGLASNLIGNINTTSNTLSASLQDATNRSDGWLTVNLNTASNSLMSTIYTASNQAYAGANTYTVQATNDLNTVHRAVIIATNNALVTDIQNATNGLAGNLIGNINTTSNAIMTVVNTASNAAVAAASVNTLNATNQSSTWNIANLNSASNALMSTIYTASNQAYVGANAFATFATNTLATNLIGNINTTSNALVTGLTDATNRSDGWLTVNLNTASNSLMGTIYTASNQAYAGANAYTVQATNDLNTVHRAVIIATNSALLSTINTASNAAVVSATANAMQMTNDVTTTYRAVVIATNNALVTDIQNATNGLAGNLTANLNTASNSLISTIYTASNQAYAGANAFASFATNTLATNLTANLNTASNSIMTGLTDATNRIYVGMTNLVNITSNSLAASILTTSNGALAAANTYASFATNTLATNLTANLNTASNSLLSTFNTISNACVSNAVVAVGSPTNLTIAGQIVFTANTNILVDTNVIGLWGNTNLGVNGTYKQWSPALSPGFWTNWFFPQWVIQQSGPVFTLQSNGITWYTTTNTPNQQWTAVAGPPPGPFGSYGIDLRMNGIWVSGWLASSNLTWQITNNIALAPVGGYLSGWVSNATFSASGLGAISNLVVLYGIQPTNGITAQQATNIVTSFDYVSTNLPSNNGSGLIPYTTNASPGYFWAAPPSGGGGSGIPMLNGLGTNTALTNGIYAIETNLYVLNISPITTNNLFISLSNNISIGNTNTLLQADTSNSIAIGSFNYVTKNGGIESYYNSILEGAWNTNASAGFGVILNGIYNHLLSLRYEEILGGSNNWAHGEYDSVLNGSFNKIDGNTVQAYQLIGNGSSNYILGPFGFIGNGQGNSIGSGGYESILNGQNNLLDPTGGAGQSKNSTIVGGQNNTIDGSGALQPLNATIANGQGNYALAGSGTFIAGSSNYVTLGRTSGSDPTLVSIGFSNSIISGLNTNSIGSMVFGDFNTVVESSNSVVIGVSNAINALHGVVYIGAPNGVYINGSLAVTSSLTNGLATTAYVQTATNGFTGPQVYYIANQGSTLPVATRPAICYTGLLGEFVKTNSTTDNNGWYQTVADHP